MKYGYIRGTTEDVIERQRKSIMQHGVDKIFVDKQIGARDQLQLKEMMYELQNGDIVVLESISKLARSTMKLFKAIETFYKKDVTLISLNSGINTSSEIEKQVIKMIAKESEIERSYLKDSQLNGIAEAKQNNTISGKKKIMPDDKLFVMVYAAWKKGNGAEGKLTAREAMKILGLKPNTFYRRVSEYEIGKTTEEIIDFG